MAALEATADTTKNTDKFDRFANQILGKSHPDEAKKQLEKDLAAEIDRVGARVEANAMPSGGYPEHYPGPGRIDAYGQVYNQVAGLDLEVPGNIAKVNAPASIPYLWNAHYADRVQWNGAGDNTEKKLGLLMGPLARNLVEILGVFGRLEFPKSKLDSYKSTIDVRGLGALEAKLCTLHPPKWPAELPAPDAALVEKGRILFAADGKGKCGNCHISVAPETKHEVTRWDTKTIGTDPNLADNAMDRMAKTGRLKGTMIGIISGPTFGDDAKAYEIVKNAVAGVVLETSLQP